MGTEDGEELYPSIDSSDCADGSNAEEDDGGNSLDVEDGGVTEGVCRSQESVQAVTIATPMESGGK